MVRRGLTHARVARDLGVDRSTVTRAINGDVRTTRARVLHYIATLLGVGVEQLRPGRPPRASSNVPKRTSPLVRGSISNKSENSTDLAGGEAA